MDKKIALGMIILFCSLTGPVLQKQILRSSVLFMMKLFRSNRE